MPALARLAATHRTARDLEMLRALHDDLAKAIEDSHLFAILNTKWRLAVATASGNELLCAILHSVSHSGTSALGSSGGDPNVVTRREVIDICIRVNVAIEAGNGTEAERLMICHIKGIRATQTCRVGVEIELDPCDIEESYSRDPWVTAIPGRAT
ncbi:FadR/GntR family transcriptional regulator [Caballeronia calidae]|uniref:FadR/GntR family transcriptional regulator n=1 Tax=Caballeronia calidae TaxID=1777139 RepID=UPI0035B51A9D